MSEGLWRLVESRLRRSVPRHRVDAVLTDLAEDYAAHRQTVGAVRAGLWLLKEARSLSVAYRRRELQTFIGSVWQDGRYAFSSLRRRPLRFVAASSLLSVAIGLTTAMFTIVDALSLRPVPFKNPEQLATLYMAADPSRGGGLAPDLPAFSALRRSDVFSAAEGVWSDVARIETDAGQVRRSLSVVTPGVFAMLGDVRPVVGRLFASDDGLAGVDARVLISETLWRDSYGADPRLVGRTIRIDGQPAQVVGVLPADFRFPTWNTEVWRASTFETSSGTGNAVHPSLYVRFRADMPVAEALRRATIVARAAHSPYAQQSVGARPLVVGERDASFERAAPLLISGVILLFLVLCANVSSLQLVGITARSREFATRAALGATRGRLIRQAFLESSIAGVCGVILGIGSGAAVLTLAQTWLLDALSLHTLNTLNIDARTMAATSIVGCVASISAGVLPAAVGTRIHAGVGLQLTSRSGTESPHARAVARTLLVGQMALSCTLLLGAVLATRSFIRLAGADRGFDTRNIVVARVDLPASSYGPDNQPLRDMIKQAVIEQARAIPGVTSAAWSYGTPPQGATRFEGEFVSDVPGLPPVPMRPYMFRVDPDFFGLYEIPIVRGRALEGTDGATTAVVGERFAASLWPGLNPIGRTFSVAGSRPGPALTVVGVTKELRFPSLDRTLDAPQFYVRLTGLLNMGTISLRCSADCSEPVVSARLEAAYPGFEVYDVKTLQSAYARELARPRVSAGVALAFAMTSLLAVAAGLFSLLSHVVSRRRREFGIRAALGASARQLRGLVIRDGYRLALAGLTLGCTIALGLAHVARSFLFDVATTDLLSWVTVLSTLALTVAVALWHPARSATRTNPTLLLRDE